MKSNRIILVLSFCLMMSFFKSSAVFADDLVLENWMKVLEPAVGHLTLFDLFWPGTHDSISYDLSETVSDGAYDKSAEESWWLHDLSLAHFVPADWIRKLAKTQNLEITQQLNAGVRFIDFRAMYTHALIGEGEWYSLHFLESKKPAIEYLKEIRSWMDQHPSEIAVLWISKHGGVLPVGDAQFPGVPVEKKRKFWASIESVFSGLMVDVRESPLNQTSISTLMSRNQRLVVFASDYEQFTGNSPHAMDAHKIDNRLPGTAPAAQFAPDSKVHKILFESRKTIEEINKPQSKFLLMSLAAAGPGISFKDRFLLDHFPHLNKDKAKACALSLHIPGVTEWCPTELIEVARLDNYYSQISLESAIRCNWGYPNAIYLDGLSEDGTISLGTVPGERQESRFAYVASMLYMNVKRACEGSSATIDSSQRAKVCEDLLELLSERRARFPLKRWNDPEHGRIESTWPVDVPNCRPE